MTGAASNKDGQRGLVAAQELAREFGVAERAVIEEYESEVARMQRTGAIRQFVDLLAVKHVKAALMARRQPARSRDGAKPARVLEAPEPQAGRVP